MYSPNHPATDRTSHFRLFRRTIKLADTVIAGNSYLAEHAKKFNNNVHILPTSLDTNEYSVENPPNTLQPPILVLLHCRIIDSPGANAASKSSSIKPRTSQ
jgi:hypothetical protein